MRYTLEAQKEAAVVASTLQYDDDESDPANQVTMKLPGRPRSRNFIGPFCQICYLEERELAYPMIFDARRYALAICERHRREWELASDEQAEIYEQLQLQALRRFVLPFPWRYDE